MTDHKFTDDEIIKALECCAKLDRSFEECDKCPYKGECGTKDGNMPADALALINRQKAEIERLQAVHADMTESLRLAAEANKDMQAEIERLEELAAEKQNLTEQWQNKVGELLAEKQIIEAEAIKEFAWRLKNRLTPYPEAPFCEMVGSLDIDALVKEMTEELK